jgi:hypothetical protein
MDPYLEHPALWPDVHAKLISEMQTYLNRLIRPKYVACVESRVYVSGGDDPGRTVIIPDIRIEGRKNRSHLPVRSTKSATATIEPTVVPVLIDEEIEETYLSIQEPVSAKVVTVIEVLCPANKIRNAEGRKSFLKKRRDVMLSDAHWVEVDLLRAGERDPATTPSDYRAIVVRGNRHGRGNCYLISLRQPLPEIGIPLKGKDPDVALDLGAVLEVAYDAAGYDARVDYTRPPVPPLSPADEKWANQLLRNKGLRTAQK